VPSHTEGVVGLLDAAEGFPYGKLMNLFNFVDQSLEQIKHSLTRTAVDDRDVDLCSRHRQPAGDVSLLIGSKLHCFELAKQSACISTDVVGQLGP